MIITKSNGLCGEVIVPGDKSISHRAVMLGSIADGVTTIENFLCGDDCLSTIECFRSMGVDIQINDTTVIINGVGKNGLKMPVNTLYTGNSGTTTRILSGILAGQSFPCEITGDSSICTRPMNRIITPLSKMGAHIESHNDCCPMKFTKAKLSGITYELPVASAQLKSAVLLAGLYADTKTTVIEHKKSRNHTENMLERFGADIVVTEDDNSVTYINITGENTLKACNIYVPSDISSAAFFIVAGLIIPRSNITIKNVGINQTRAGIIEVLKKMGGDITLTNISKTAEPYADITVRTSNLVATNIGGDIIPNIIDEIPILAVACALAKGTSIISDAAELKVKECNRIDAITTELKKAGIDIEKTDDGMIITGVNPVKNAEFDTYNDHRIAMSLSILAMLSKQSEIKESDVVSVSFPNFYDILKRLGK